MEILQVFSKGAVQKTIYQLLFFLSLLGLYFLFIATLINYSRNFSSTSIDSFLIQVVILLFGFFAMFIISKVPYSLYLRFKWFIFVISVGLMSLLFTPLSISRDTSTRWLDIFGFNFQPSEIMKIAFILFIAYLLSKEGIVNNWIKFFGLLSIGLGIVVGFSLYQPDFGTLLILLSVLFGMFLIAKLPIKTWLVLSSGFLVGFTVLIFFLPSYISSRFSVFWRLITNNLSLEDRFGEAFHSLTNLSTVQSGGFFGNGIGSSINLISIPPEISTDSIFALVAYETGFIGVLVVISLFLLLFISCFSIASRSPDKFALFFATGLSLLLAVQVFLNILVVLGAPATGIPLLFFSKGGTSLLVTFGILGILLNIEKSPKSFLKI